MTHRKTRRGFTLIELLVVVLIIGVLAAVALPQYQKSVNRSKGAQDIVIAKSLAEAANRYYLANGSYKGIGIDKLDISVPSNIGNNWWAFVSAFSGNTHVATASVSRYNISLKHTNSGSLSLIYNLRNGAVESIVCDCANASTSSEAAEICVSFYGDLFDTFSYDSGHESGTNPLKSNNYSSSYGSSYGSSYNSSYAS